MFPKMKLRLKGRHFLSIEELHEELLQARRHTSISASKKGKITGIVVYKPKVNSSKVMVEITTYGIHAITSKFSEILGSPPYTFC